MLNILCKLVKIWYLVNVSVNVAASQPITATSLVNFSYYIMQRLSLPLSCRKLMHHAINIPTLFNS